jgi:hypothetical protein
MSFKLTEITFENLTNEVNYQLQKMYNKASQLFTNASPYGSILNVIKILYTSSLNYLKKSINQFNLNNANADNYDLVRTAAIVAGHNPARATSASGTLRCQVKVSTDISESIPRAQVKIKNKTVIRNATNNLLYHIDLGGTDEQVFTIRSGKSFFLNIAQGEWKEASFTGTGEMNQSYEVNAETKEVENNRIEVTVNGEFWEVKNHIYELLPDEKAVTIQTSFNGGLIIKFGNGNYGLVPPLNSEIKVNYVETDGSIGNIYRRTNNDFKFVDQALGGDGVSIDFERLFNIYIHTDINFGSDGEDIEFMKNIIPINTNNFVLALPQQYAYAIKRLGVFSHVNAYDDNGVVKIVATPDIRIFKNRNADYYTVDKAAFELDTYEKTKLDNYLRNGGYIQLTKKYRIDTPVLSYYVMFVNLRLFEDAIEENVKNEIVEKTSEYFLNLNRLDRIPKKDIINLISEIDEVDSVDVRFVSKKNEDYHKQYLLQGSNTGATVSTLAGYNPNTVLGIDPVLGDIVFEPKEYPIIRGGWTDRNDIFYSETPFDGFSSINISVKGFTPRNNNI